MDDIASPLRGEKIRAIKSSLVEYSRRKAPLRAFILSELVAVHPHLLRHARGFALADQGADTRLSQDSLGPPDKRCLMPQHQMRTTLQLDDDVLAAPGSSSEHQRSEHRNGLPLLPWKQQGAPVDLELVNSLRDELA